MAPSPYAPPKSEVAAASSVDVDVNRALPLVCLKCGATKEVSPRPETLHVMTRRARMILLLVLVVGTFAVVFFQAPEVRVAVIVFIVVAGRVMRMGARPALPKVDLGLPLCVACDDRWTVGMRRRRVYRALIVFGGIFMFLTVVLLSPMAVFIFLPPMLGLSIANALIRIRSRVVVATALKDDIVTLSLVHPDAVAAIRARA